MTYHIRTRPSALVIKDDSILLVECFSEKNGIHYYIPGGGSEVGETLKATARREFFEETMAEITIGPVAFLYECEPQIRINEYSPQSHTLFIIFDCQLVDGSEPKIPILPEENQIDVKWIPLRQLSDIKLIPNIANLIIEYSNKKRNIDLIEDHIVR